MKRKIIKQGNSGLTMSLPIGWARELNLEAGHEIDVKLIGKDLVVSANKQKTFESIKINAEGLNPIIKRYLASLYRAGYDEVEVTYEDGETLELIYDVIEKELIGFEIVKQGNKSCVIKDIAGMENEEFDVLLRRCFLLLTAIAEESHLHIKNKNTRALKHIKHKDKNINKLTNFCERMLIKKNGKGVKQTAFLYHLIKEIENIGDEYKFLSNYCYKNKAFPSKRIIDLHENINRLLSEMHYLFYKFDKKGITEKELKISELKQEVKGLFKSNKDNIVLYHLGNILRRLETMIGSYFSLRVE